MKYMYSFRACWLIWRLITISLYLMKAGTVFVKINYQIDTIIFEVSFFQ